MNPIRHLGLALLASLGISSAQAAEYTTIDPAQSQLTFAYQQMGVAMEGRFSRFSSELRFDPEQVEAAQLQLDVELASVNTGTADGNSELATKDWFNTAAFPQARFVSTAVKALGNGQLEVHGTLDIKGQQREIVIPAQFSTEGEQARFNGQFTIQRGSFSIGEGAWKAFDIVANDVTIHFKLQAGTH